MKEDLDLTVTEVAKIAAGTFIVGFWFVAFIFLMALSGKA